MTAEPVNVEPLARARALVAGVVCAGVVHEFANLLTVIDGVRQIRSLHGVTSSDGDELLEKPATRCHDLVEAFRHVFSRPAGDVGVPAAAELEALALLLEIRLRGRRTRVRIAACPDEARVPADRAAAARIAFLCRLLAVLEEHPGEEAPDALEIGVRGTQPVEAYVALLAGAAGGGAVAVGSGPQALASELREAAEGLERDCRFELTVEEAAGGRRITLCFGTRGAADGDSATI